MGNCIDYGTLDGAILHLISMLLRLKNIKQGDTFFYLNAFVAHSKQWAGFFRAVRLFNMGYVEDCIDWRIP